MILKRMVAVYCGETAHLFERVITRGCPKLIMRTIYGMAAFITDFKISDPVYSVRTEDESESLKNDTCSDENSETFWE